MQPHAFFCPKRYRRARLEQYTMQPAARTKLPEYIMMPVQDSEEAPGVSCEPIIDLVEEDSVPAPVGLPALAVNKVCSANTVLSRMDFQTIYLFQRSLAQWTTAAAEDIMDWKRGYISIHLASEEEDLLNLSFPEAPNAKMVQPMQAHSIQAETAKPSRPPMMKEIANAAIALEVPLPDKTRPRKPTRQPLRLDMNKATLFRARSHMPMTQQEVAKILADPRSMPDSDDEEDLDEWKVNSSLDSNQGPPEV